MSKRIRVIEEQTLGKISNRNEGTEFFSSLTRWLIAIWSSSWQLMVLLRLYSSGSWQFIALLPARMIFFFLWWPIAIIIAVTLSNCVSWALGMVSSYGHYLPSFTTVKFPLPHHLHQAQYWRPSWGWLWWSW